jgi:uncharacterized membrane protein YvlD (DUF360 family)
MLWLLTAWLMSAASIWVTAEILSGFRVTRGALDLLIVAAILGLLNALLGGLLFFVIGIGTLGIGWLLAPVTQIIVTGLLLMLTDKFSDSLEINDVPTAFLGALVMTIIYNIGMWLLGVGA